MSDQIRVPDELRDLLADVEGTVFQPSIDGEDWSQCLDELTLAYQLSKAAAETDQPVVYVVHNDDLLGRRGAIGAMIATGLLSAMRTLALETAKKGVPANMLAVDDNTTPEHTALWVKRLLEREGPTGELVHIGPAHIGKALV